MQLNKSFLAIGNGQTDGQIDICDSRVAFATEKFSGGGGGGLFDYSVTPGPFF